MPPLIWTEAALANVRRLYRFLAETNLAAAKRAVKVIRDGVGVLAAHPQAGRMVEDMDELFRQFFPKKMRFESITRKDIKFAMHRLNHRPRKRLGFKTPHEVFMKQLHSRHNAVALQT